MSCCHFSKSMKTVRSKIFFFSLNPFVPRAFCALIGQMAQSVVISLPLTACLGNKTAITMSKMFCFFSRIKCPHLLEMHAVNWQC